jgi:hypothetical protein
MKKTKKKKKTKQKTKKKKKTQAGAEEEEEEEGKTGVWRLGMPAVTRIVSFYLYLCGFGASSQNFEK